jgi:hypothetical protein
MKHLTPEKAEAKRQELLSMPLLDRKAYLAQQGMTSADTAKLFESMPKEKTDGRTKWTEEGNPRLPTFGQRMMGTKPITMQLSPGEASTAATAAARLDFDKTKVQWERDNPGFTIEKVGQPDGTEQFVAVDKRTRQATPINMAPTAAPAGSGRGSVGTTDATAGVSAGVPLVGASSKPLNESQSNATAFGMRMKEANSIAEKLISSGTLRGANIESVPFIGESLGKVLPSAVGGTSGQQQQLNQAKSNFITAVLRKESGAVISDSEFDRENAKYFPQVNDDKATIKQKANARKLAIEAIKIQAGPGAKSIDQLKVSGDTDGEWKVVK